MKTNEKKKKSWRQKRKERKEEKKRVKEATKLFRKQRRNFRLFMWLIVFVCFGIPILGHFWFHLDWFTLMILVFICGGLLNWAYNRRARKIEKLITEEQKCKKKQSSCAQPYREK